MGLNTFLTKTLGLTKLPPYLNTILISFLGFTFIHLVIAPWVCSRWFPVAYGTKGKAAKNSWAIHFVSQVHTVIIVPMALYSILTETPDRALDKAFGWSDFSGTVHGIAVGYFLWDTIDAIVNFVELGFVVHGVACFMVYAMSYRPFVTYFATRCLLWETSTLFLNIHWFLDKTNRTGTNLQLVNGILLLSAFFGVRLIYGGSVSMHFFLTLLKVRREIPLFYVIVLGGGNIVLQGLNIFWFTKMIAALRKRFEPPKPRREDEQAGLLIENGARSSG